MRREAETERDRRATAVRGDRHPGGDRRLATLVTDYRPTDDRRRAPFVDARPPDADPRIELTAGRHRLLQQQRVELAPRDRPARQSTRVGSFDRHAAPARHPHPVDPQAALLDPRRETERLET